MSPRYKFVEVSPVTDETLERAVNEWVARGYHFDGIHFVVKENSHRPCMAFVALFRDEAPSEATLPPASSR
jgi:hypothetical protein